MSETTSGAALTATVLSMVGGANTLNTRCGRRTSGRDEEGAERQKIKTLFIPELSW